MTALVTGGSGFLGRSLIRTLLASGESIRALHRRETPPFTAPGLTWHRHILGVPIDWPVLLDGVRCVYHLAWSTLPQSSNEDPANDAVTNVAGTLDILEAVRRTPVGRIVFTSSGGTVYGAVQEGRASESHEKAPLCAYGVSKLSVENYLALYERQWGVPGVSLRLSNPFGPDQEAGRNFGVVATFAGKALAGQPCTIFGDGTVERDFLFVDDAVEALIAAGSRPGATGVYNIGSGEGRSIRQVVTAIEAELGRPVAVDYAAARSFDPPRTVLDAGRAAAELGWRARTAFEEGVRRVIAAHRTS
jgi:UDP-glucose 4-epimerase